LIVFEVFPLEDAFVVSSGRDKVLLARFIPREHDICNVGAVASKLIKACLFNRAWISEKFDEAKVITSCNNLAIG
jgi:hypothetical protein